MSAFTLAVAVFSLLAATPAEAGELGWRKLQAGVEYVEVSGKESGLEGDERIHVVRVDPGRVDMDLNGSYETGFNENDDEKTQWPIPNVLGVARH